MTPHRCCVLLLLLPLGALGLTLPSLVTTAAATLSPPTPEDWNYAAMVSSSAVASCAATVPVIFTTLEKARRRREEALTSLPEVPETPYGGGADAYDPKLADEFYRRRPLLVASRVVSLLQATLGFQVKLFLDWKTGNLQRNEQIRAKEALALATECGPTIIKLAQALSIRTDLIPEAYALELRQLQDAVPPFPDAQAKKVIEDALGVEDVSELFSDFEETCIASASIGQVYRATLKPGRYYEGAPSGGGVDRVAVKVQRPGVLAEICLDLYLLRLLSPLQVWLSNAINDRETDETDVKTAIELVDEWGRGFVNEVDYLAEARNTRDFSEAMKKRGLDAVIAPRVVSELTKGNVLVTEWIDGTRLDVSASPDVPRLCGVAINAYLTMLLDSGVLHCDPHPGNLLRTEDGKLCILDFGMTLEVPSNLRYSLLEFIAHVNTENLDAIPRDFVNLGFTPPEKLDKVASSGITDGLSFMLRQLSAGGGPSKIRERVKAEFVERYGDVSDEELRKKARDEMVARMEDQLEKEGVDVRGVSNVMEEMSRRNRELFRLPSWVLYTVRAFSTLEGIGLSANEDYAIIQECYPYLARRLFTDNSPRAKVALEAMLSTRSGAGLNVDKLVEMAEGFTTYTVSTTAVGDDLKINLLLEQDDDSNHLLPQAAAADFGPNNNNNPGRGLVPRAAETTTTLPPPTTTAPETANDRAMVEAQRELVGVLLAKNGSVAQKLVLDEATRLVDSTVRSSLASLVESSGLTAESIVEALDDDDNSPRGEPFLRPAIRNLRNLPAPARLGLLPLTAPLEAASALANVVAPLVSVDDRDRAALRTVSSLSNIASAGTRDTNVADLARKLAPDGDLTKLVVDPDTADSVNVLSRRFAATLLRRAAGRLEESASPHDQKQQPRLHGLERSAAKAAASTLAETYRQAARALSPDTVY